MVVEEDVDEDDDEEEEAVNDEDDGVNEEDDLVDEIEHDGRQWKHSFISANVIVYYNILNRKMIVADGDEPE